MFYAKSRKEALTIHETAVDKYNSAFQNMEKLGNQLYEKRQDSVALIYKIEFLVNSIANKPKEFNKKISDIRAEREKFRETEVYAEEAIDATVKSGAGVVAGVAGGATVASMAPSAAMWVATTFGTASTGTAISTLSGAAATKAALAWLGGGALSAGGAGIAGGQALLALAGPIGWGITGVTTAVSVFALGHKNKKIAEDATAEAKKLTLASAELNQSSVKIQHITDETVILMDALQGTVMANQYLKGKNYRRLSEEKQYQLGTMVNNTLSLAQLLNKTL